MLDFAWEAKIMFGKGLLCMYIHRKIYFLTRYLTKHRTVPFKQPSQYIHDTRDIHAAVYHSHMDVDPCIRYYLNSTAPLPMWIRTIHVKTPLNGAIYR